MGRILPTQKLNDAHQERLVQRSVHLAWMVRVAIGYEDESQTRKIR
jgi:hypothetical protein